MPEVNTLPEHLESHQPSSPQLRGSDTVAEDEAANDGDVHYPLNTAHEHRRRFFRRPKNFFRTLFHRHSNDNSDAGCESW